MIEEFVKNLWGNSLGNPRTFLTNSSKLIINPNRDSVNYIFFQKHKIFQNLKLFKQQFQVVEVFFSVLFTAVQTTLRPSQTRMRVDESWQSPIVTEDI